MTSFYQLKLQVWLSLLLGLGVSVGVAQAQSGNLEPPASAVNGSGDPLATTQTQPSWDQLLPTSERFQVLTRILGGGGGPIAFDDWGVLDRETGLVWERTPQASFMSWNIAYNQCTSSKVGGRLGWRLPEVHELASLVNADHICNNCPSGGPPALPPGHPFLNVQGQRYWTATLDPTFSQIGVRLVDFQTGRTGTTSNAVINQELFWCVRGK